MSSVSHKNILEIPIKHKLSHFFHYFSFLLIKLMPVYYQNSNTRNNVENVWLLVPYSPNDGYTYTMQLIKWIKYIHILTCKDIQDILNEKKKTIHSMFNSFGLKLLSIINHVNVYIGKIKTMHHTILSFSGLLEMFIFYIISNKDA